MKKNDIARVRESMMDFFKGDPKRIFHFLKVHELAQTIGLGEQLDERTQYLTEMAALVHDIGIPAAIENYGSSAGKYQEFEGPTLAGELLEDLGLEDDTIDRVCFLVSVHHTYKDIVGLDWQILLEADFLVNAFEDQYSLNQILNAKERFFKTDTGKKLLEQLYPKD